MKVLFKRIVSLALCAAVIFSFSSTSFAEEALNIQNIQNIKGEWSAKATGLDEGYYDVRALCKNSSVSGRCYIYARSAASSEGRGAVPKSAASNADKDGYSEVVIRSVYTANGIIDIGLKSDGGDEVITKSVTVTKADGERVFLNGGDISEYTYVKDMGGKYYDFDGVTEVNPIEFLADNGMNAVRIRLTNKAGKGRGDGKYYLKDGYQDLEDCLALSKQAKDSGMSIVFTFNYSDYWSNGKRQIIPQDFADEIQTELGYDIKNADFLKSMTSDQRAKIQNKLTEQVYNYTKDCMERLKEQDTVPEYVSIGNEINGGMLFPFANTYAANMGSDDFELNFDDEITQNDIKCPKDLEALGRILNAGYRAIKEISPDTKVIVHFAGDALTDNFNWILGDAGFKRAGECFDVLGISYYPAWSDKVSSECLKYSNTLSSHYNKDIMIMETGFNFSAVTTDGYGGQLKSIDAYKDIYPDTLEGHKGYLTEMINNMKRADRCIGVLYWDPLMIHTEDGNGNNNSGWAYREDTDRPEKNVVENTTLFDFKGRAIDSVRVYNDTINAGKYYSLNALTENKAVINKNGNSNAVLIISAYDAHGILSGVMVKDLKDADTGVLEFSYDLNAMCSGAEAKKIKAFIWNMDESNEPLCLEKKITR